MAMNNKPKTKNNSLASLAGRIANLAIPSSANNIFAQLQENQVKKYGMDFGNASDPRKFFMSSNAFTDQVQLGLGSTMTLKQAQSKIMQETRAELARKSGQLEQYTRPLQKGIATADQHKFCDHTNGIELNQQNQDQWIQEQRTTNNIAIVEDQRWPVTLAQIVGSKMLTTEQLKAASIQNVSKYFNVVGGNYTEQAEMRYMFQRMMLEGFIRGVDITKDLPKQNNRLTVYLDPGSTVASNPNNIGLSTQGTVRFNLNYMRKQNDNVKLSLFYHEMGHELLNKSHSGKEGIMKSGGSYRSGQNLLKSTASYNALMNDLFSSSGSRAYNHLKVPINRGVQANYDPSWFPSIGKADPSTYLDPINEGDKATQNVMQIPSTNVTVSNTTINPFQAQGAKTTNTGTIDTSGAGRPQTMNTESNVQMPQQNVQVNNGFSTATAQAGQQSATLEGMAGALNQLRAG